MTGLEVRHTDAYRGHIGTGTYTDELKLLYPIMTKVVDPVYGKLTILDNGQGALFSSSNSTGVADAAGTNGAPASLNDDRAANPLVNNIAVNEASPYAVFTVSGKPGAEVSLVLARGSTAGTATLGTDFGTGLVYFDPTDNCCLSYTTVSDVNMPAIN